MLFSRCHGLPLLVLMILISLTACGGSGGSSPSSNTGPSLSRIEVTPSQPTLAKGTTLNLTATGIYSDNSTRTLTNDVSWQSTNDSVASLSIAGGISAITAGQVSIQASLDGITGDTKLTVTNAVLSRLELNPSSVQLANGTRQAVSLIGHYTDDSTQDVTEQATWAFSDTSIASLSDPIIRDNFWLTGLAIGTTQLTASLGAISTQMAVTISAANLIQIDISPEAPELPLSTTLNLTALGLYSDGSNQDLTAQVSWGSADAGVLTIDTFGHVQPQAVGNTTATAGLAGITASQTITVNDAVLNTIEISASSIPLGNHQPLLALGHFSDGSLHDITGQVVWQSTPTDLVSISNAGGSRGIATALAVGNVTVTATLGGISGSINLSASAASLSSIDISPISARLAVGTQTTFHAIGHYSDGTIQDISEQASWATADAGIATISNAPGWRGLALALTPDNTTIVSASLDGQVGNATLAVTAAQLLSINVLPSEVTLPAGTQQTVHVEGSFSDGSVQVLDDQVTWKSDAPTIAVVSNGELTALQSNSNQARISASLGDVSGYTTVSVTSATLSSLQIHPGSPTLAVGTETQLQAIAVYSDGSQEDVTTQATWGSADDTRLRAENSANRQGRLTALGTGSPVIVTANFGGIQNSVSVSVGSAVLTGLNIVASSPSMDSAEQQQLTAIGTFSDSTTQDLSAEVIWSSDAPGLANVSNNAGDRGRVGAGINVSGVAVITARYGSFNPTLALTINNTPDRPVSLVVLATPNVIRNDGIDASTLEIRVQAADPTSTVADGTAIEVQILQNDIVLSSQPLVTSGGIASTSFTTTETGLLQIKATTIYNGTTISNNTALYTSATLYDVIAGAAFADAQVSGSSMLSGSRFGFIIYNLSNRNFPLNQFVLLNGSDILLDTGTDTGTAALNGNVLTGGQKLGIIYTLNADVIDQGIVARYYLTDPATGNPFSFGVTFTAP